MGADLGSAEAGDFWSALPAADAAKLEALGRLREFDRGQTLFHERQTADRVLVVRRGRVKVMSTTSNGREVLLAFRGPGDLIGDLAMVDGGSRSATVRAIEPVRALAFDPTAFRAFLLARPAVLMLLLTMVGRRLRAADAKVIEFSSLTTIERVAARLLEFGERFGTSEGETLLIALPLSQEELAGATGASLESVGRALSTMRALKCVETRRREIRILDWEGLRGLSAAP
jgi:CRP/FNR family cyclic AMP-dependent transcriptional regulator